MNTEHIESQIDRLSAEMDKAYESINTAKRAKWEAEGNIADATQRWNDAYARREDLLAVSKALAA